MKKLLSFFAFLFFCLVPFLFPFPVFAQPPIGTHTFYSHGNAFLFIHGEDPMTIMLFVDDIILDTGEANAGVLDELDAYLDRRPGVNIIRIAGRKSGNTYLPIDKPKEVAQALEKHLLGDDLYFVFGNEVNNPSREWGGGNIPNPDDYAKRYLQFYDAISPHARDSGRIKVAPAALDPYFYNDKYPVSRAAEFIDAARRAWDNADAYAFNVYHIPGKEDIKSHDSYLSYLWLIEQAGLSANKPLLLTEFSLKPTEYDENLEEVANFIVNTAGQLTGNIVAVTPLIRNPCKENSFLFYRHPGEILDIDGTDITESGCSQAGGTTLPGDPSLVCVDWDVPLGITGATKVSARLRAEPKMPDLSGMAALLEGALKWLLPQKLNEKVSLPQNRLKLDSYHYQDQTEGTSVLRTTATTPPWWAKVLGVTKIFGGLFGTCPPPESLAIRIGQSPLKIPSAETICTEGKLVGAEVKLESEEEGGFSLWEIITSAINSLFGRVTGKTRGSLAGGELFPEQVKFLNSFIPYKLTSKGKEGEERDSAVKVSYRLTTESSEGESQENFTFQGLKEDPYCTFLCGVRPHGISVRLGDSFCPPCEKEETLPTDGEEPGANVGLEPPGHLKPQYCQWAEDNVGCHYYEPGLEQIINCSESPDDPGRCLPTSLPPPGEFFSADSPCRSLCHWETFEPNSEGYGGYSDCFYTNYKVCVRNDGVGGCGGLCNPACCANPL